MPRAIWNGAVLAESDQGVVVDGQINRDAAWYYAEPSEAAKPIKDHVAFWRGVKVER